jgi:hypothetical protein
MTERMDLIPLSLLFLATCVFAWLAIEVGYRFGRWRHSLAAAEKEAPVGAMVGSILGLLAFLLAFTFGMAGSRFDARRQAVLEEANAIRTAYLRTRLLPEPQRTETADLLRKYVDVRIQGVREGKIVEALAQSEELQEALWSRAVAATKNKEAVPGIPGLFVTSLNETIDVSAKRVQVGLNSRIPSSIWLGLLALALLSMGALGYQSGLAMTRRSPAMLGIVLAFAGVLYLIADLDRAGEGLLSVSQQALLDVQKTMHGTSP